MKLLHPKRKITLHPNAYAGAAHTLTHQLYETTSVVVLCNTSKPWVIMCGWLNMNNIFNSVYEQLPTDHATEKDKV